MKTALTQFQKLHGHLVGAGGDEEGLFNQISLSTRILLCHFRRCSRSASTWVTCCNKARVGETELESIKEVLATIKADVNHCPHVNYDAPPIDYEPEVDWAALVRERPPAEIFQVSLHNRIPSISPPNFQIFPRRMLPYLSTVCPFLYRFCTLFVHFCTLFVHFCTFFVHFCTFFVQFLYSYWTI